jgi:hypothetical protein
MLLVDPGLATAELRFVAHLRQPRHALTVRGHASPFVWSGDGIPGCLCARTVEQPGRS